jgi:hypothetical protein
MNICESCDHNVIIECQGGCFYPHHTPPCFRQAIESQTTAVQQLKAEIAALAEQASKQSPVGSFIMHRWEIIQRLKQLSAI